VDGRRGSFRASRIWGFVADNFVGLTVKNRNEQLALVLYWVLERHYGCRLVALCLVACLITTNRLQTQPATTPV
jgi:hypothetical protein